MSSGLNFESLTKEIVYFLNRVIEPCFAIIAFSNLMVKYTWLESGSPY